jgi:chlorobactene glucosyltransferase
MPEAFYFKPATLMTFLALPLSLRANNKYRHLPELPAYRAVNSLPSLTIIVPARDEAHNLPGLLGTLKHLSYPGQLEILVVDDHSSDHTGELAGAYGVRVLALEGGLPKGWKGKPHACHQGALTCQSEWLLFTDADTLHLPHGPARAVAYACQHNLDGLSLFLRQDTRAWTDRLALSAAYAGLFAGQHPDQHILNGQFILIRRLVYEQSGGFAAVHAEALEDVALGNWLARSGYQLPLLRGENAARVRMYTSHTQMFNGLARLGSNALLWQKSRAVLPLALITAFMSPWITLLGVLRGRVRWPWLPLTWGVSAVSLLPWVRRFGPTAWTLLAPLGALIMQAAAVYGILRRLFGRGIPWKGRRV